MAVLDTTTNGAVRDEASPLGVNDYPFSIAAWVRITTAQNCNVAGFGHTDVSLPNNWHRGAIRMGGTRAWIQSRVSASAVAEAGTTPTLSTETWYPIVWVWSASNSRKVYSGALANVGSDSTELTSFTGSTGSINESGGRFSVGRRTYDTTEALLGKVAHVAVWNKALGDDEITAFMGGGNPLTIANEIDNDHLLSYWADRFEEDGGTTYWRDESGNGNDLTLLTGASVDEVTTGPTVDDPPTGVVPGIIITGIKEPNEANTLVASVSSPRVKVWSGTDDSGAENLLFENEDAIYPITNGTLEVPLPTYSVDDVVTVEVMWTVGTERKLFIKETTVVDLEAGT